MRRLIDLEFYLNVFHYNMFVICNNYKILQM